MFGDDHCSVDQAGLMPCAVGCKITIKVAVLGVPFDIDKHTAFPIVHPIGSLAHGA